MGVRCDWFLLIYLQIIAINAITLPLTTTSTSIPVKPLSTSVSSPGTSSSDCATSSTDDRQTSPSIREKFSKSLNPFSSSTEPPTKVSTPCENAITASNSNLENLNVVALALLPDNNCASNYLDTYMSPSNIVTNVMVPSKKGFTSPLKLAATTSESPTSVFVKPWLHCGTQSRDSSVSSPKSSCGYGLSPEVVDSPKLLPLWNINPALCTEGSNPTVIKSLGQQSNSIANNDLNALPLSGNTPYNHSPSSSNSPSITNSPDITMALLNLNPISTSNSPKSFDPQSLSSESKNVDTDFSLPNIVSYFFPSLPKVAAVPGSTLSSFNFNPMLPAESPNCSAIKPHENNYPPNNFDLLALSPSPPRLVSGTLYPVYCPPKDQTRPESSNNIHQKQIPANSDTASKNIKPNIVSPGNSLSLNVNPILAVDNLVSSITKSIQDGKDKLDTAAFVSSRKYINDFSSSSKPGIVSPPPNLSCTTSVQEKLSNIKKCFSSSLNIVPNNFPTPPDSSNQRLVVAKPNLYLVASPESLNCKTVPQVKPDSSNTFYNNLQYFPSAIVSPKFLPLPNLRPMVTSEYFNNFYPFVLQENTLLADTIEGSAQSCPLPNNYVYSSIVLASPENAPPKVTPVASLESSKSNKIQESIFSDSPRFTLSTPNVNSLTPLPTHISPNDVPLTETIPSKCPSAFDPKSSGNRYPEINKETILPKVIPFSPKTIVNQAVRVNGIPNINPTSSPLNITPGVSLNIDITSIPCTNPVGNKVTISTEPGNIITPAASGKYVLPTNVPQPQAEEFLPQPLPSPNFVPCPFLPKTLNAFSSKLNTFVIPPKMPNSSISHSPVQSSPKSEIVSTVISPFTNPSTNTFTGVYPPSSNPTGAKEFIPNNILTNPLGKCVAVNNVASLTPTKYETFSNNPNTLKTVLANTPYPVPEVMFPLSDVSLSRTNNIQSFNPVIPATSLIGSVIQISPNTDTFSDIDRKLTSILTSPASYTSPSPAIVPCTAPVTSFNYSDTISPEISTQSTDKIVSSINDIASSLTKDILSSILAKSLSAKAESFNTKASMVNTPSANSFASKFTESDPTLFKELSSIINNEFSSCYDSKSALPSPSVPVETTKLDDYSTYLATSLLPDIIKALQLLINTPKEPEFAPSTQLTPYISSLTINIIPSIEDSSPDTHIILPSYVPTEYTTPLSPAYYPAQTVPSYLPTLSPIVLETPVVQTNSFNDDSREAKRLLEFIILSELMNGDENCDWDTIENIVALLCAS